MLLVLLCTKHVISTCFHNAFGYGFLTSDGVYRHNASPQVQCIDEFGDSRYLIRFDADFLLTKTEPIGLRPSMTIYRRFFTLFDLSDFLMFVVTIVVGNLMSDYVEVLNHAEECFNRDDAMPQ